MNILLPWSLSSYFPYYGFRGQYRGLAQPGAHRARLLVPAPITQHHYARLLVAGVYQNRAVNPPPAWADGLRGGRFTFRDHVAIHDSAELAYLALLPGDVELHHSAPVTTATRPYALLCDTVMPLFQAHATDSGRVPADKADAVRDFYRAMFEADHCLTLASANQETLDELSDIFKSAAIDRKLEKLAYPQVIDGVSVDLRRPLATSFIFLNSAHGEEHPFRLGGGVVSLELALDLLREGHAVRFYFQAKRPSNIELTEWGIDTDTLARFEDNEILWLDPELDHATLTAWIASCHFLLMPGGVQQPEAIASARSYGTIPIVTDLIGSGIPVVDGEDAVVLSGLRDVVRTRDETGLPAWNAAAAHRLQPQLGQDLRRRMRELLKMPDRIKAMGDAARRAARASERNADFASSLVGVLEERLRASPVVRGRRDADRLADMPWGEDMVADLSEADFSGPPRPQVCADVGSGKIFALRQNYIFVPNARLPVTEQRWWSEPALAEQSFDLPSRPGMIVAPSLAAAADAAMPSLTPTPAGRLSPDAPLVDIAPLTHREMAMRVAYHYLQRRPMLFQTARSAYRMLRKLGAWR